MHFTFEIIALMLRVCIINNHLLHTSLLIAAAESSESFAMSEAKHRAFCSDLIPVSPWALLICFQWTELLFDFAVLG